MNKEYIDNATEAIENMNAIGHYSMTSYDYKVFVNTIESALNLQLPKKPEGFNDGCWGCGEFLSAFYDHANYCPNCGQAIDWTEELE